MRAANTRESDDQRLSTARLDVQGNGLDRIDDNGGNMARIITALLIAALSLAADEAHAWGDDLGAVVYGIAAGTVTATPAGSSAATVTPTATPQPPTEVPTETPRTLELILDQGGCAIVPPRVGDESRPAVLSEYGLALAWVAVPPAAVWFAGRRRRRRKRRPRD